MILAMSGNGMSVSRLAGELLFEGYDNPLLDLAKTLPSSTTGGAPPVDRFGLFYEVSVTILLMFNIYLYVNVWMFVCMNLCSYVCVYNIICISKIEKMNHSIY